jgi:hypothetical protein
MKYALVTRNITDLRAMPAYNSERKSQLLFGEPLKVGQEKRGFCKVSQFDGYYGWITESSIIYITQKEFKSHLKNARYVIKIPKVNVLSKTAVSEKSVSFLLYGTRLLLSRRPGNRAIIKFPGGSVISAPISAVDCVKAGREVTGATITAEIRKFLGVPYLLGGKSPFGFDCSGLVQAVYGRFGIDLPRDSKDQRNVGLRISREECRAGDLIFFKGHVAIALGKGRIIHASQKVGGITIDSLNPNHENYRSDLNDIFLQVRKII